VAYLQDVLETMGLERDRIKMIFVSAAEGERFRQLAVEMDTTIRKLGPSKLRKLQQEIAAKQTKKAQKTPA
jgi:coenzyme F420-reducing hydrogenase delta subunit